MTPMKPGNLFNLMVSALVAAGLMILFFFTLLPGCATFKHVARTVNDVASAACQLFAVQNPDEFAMLVEQVSPVNAARVQYAGFDVKEVCAIHEVLRPFIDSQLELQHRTAVGIRASVENPNADLPK